MSRNEDWFFDQFDKAMETNPKKTLIKGAVLIFAINLLFWLIIIAAVVVGLMLVF